MNIEEWSGHEVSELVLEQAANWLAKLDSNDLPESQHIAFYVWLQAEPAHQHAYMELSELWAKSACIKGMEHMLEKSKVVPFPVQLPRVVSRPDMPQSLASPAWAYSLTIGLIFVGLSLPIIQHFV
ncbi:DUF4880 domain-containing protein [uncultured Paraglaciecola sp.]|mgnify:CR=1 FL=1|uniref:FecR/PupR family sigma factor regulator n=1 Tax=uncultured Paraglaciecola sp. TaxID=1765024 RepID=UPI00262F0102|nr:DUF4880 domain-containing protein [uncultured Paraglaciecola sp.]